MRSKWCNAGKKNPNLQQEPNSMITTIIIMENYICVFESTIINFATYGQFTIGWLRLNYSKKQQKQQQKKKQIIIIIMMMMMMMIMVLVVVLVMVVIAWEARLCNGAKRQKSGKIGSLSSPIFFLLFAPMQSLIPGYGGGGGGDPSVVSI